MSIANKLIVFQKINEKDNLLPYADQLNEEAISLFERIKENLGRSILLRDIPSTFYWTSQFSRYTEVYGLRFTKEDHVLFVKLLYETIFNEDSRVEFLKMNCEILSLLLEKKKYLVPQEDLTLPWRPVYETCKKYLNRSTLKSLMHRINVNVDLDLRILVKYVRHYFPPEATNEILTELRPFLCPFDNNSISSAIMYLRLLMPVSAPTSTHLETGWISELMTLWDASNENAHWEGDMMALMSDVAHYNIGGIHWEPHLNVMFSQIFRSFRLPIRYKQRFGCQSTGLSWHPVAQWIVAVIGGKSSAQRFLEVLLSTLKSFCHPANKGSWAFRIITFLKTLTSLFIKRLVRERDQISEDGWTNQIPDESKLTDENVERFVRSVHGIAMIGTYSSDKMLDFCHIFHDLATMRADIVVPPLIERLYSSLESVTEPNKLLVALYNTSSVARSAICEKKYWDPMGPTRVLPMLRSLIPGIDPNDNAKTEATIRFVSTFAYMIPFVDCANDPQHAMDERDVKLCQDPHSIEEFVSMFLDRCFTFLECSALDITTTDGTSDQEDEEECCLADSLALTVDAIISHCSLPIFTVALNKIHGYSVSETFGNKLTNECVAKFLGSCAKHFPRETLSKVMPEVCQSIEEASQTQDLQNNETEDRQLMFRMLILREIINVRGDVLCEYLDNLEKILDTTLHAKCAKLWKSACVLFSSILTRVTSIYPINETERPQNAPLVKDWGKGVSMVDIKIEWYQPSEQEIRLVEKLVGKVLLAEFETIRFFINDESSVPKTSLQRSLKIVFMSMECLQPLPFWDEAPLNLLKMRTPPENIIFCVGVKRSIVMPDGSNIIRQIVESVTDIQKYLLENSSDDTDSLRSIAGIWAAVLFGRPRVRMEYAIPNQDELLEDSLAPNQTTKIRRVLVDEVYKRHLRRISYSHVTLTETHRKIILNLFELATSHYISVQNWSQTILDGVFIKYPDSYLLLKDRIIHNLAITSAEKAHELLGTLGILLTPIRDPILSQCDLSFMKDLFPAILNCDPPKKKKIEEMLDVFGQEIYDSLETPSVTSRIPNGVVELAKLLLPAEASPSEQDIQRGILSLDECNLQNERDYHSLIDSVVDFVYGESKLKKNDRLAFHLLICLVHKEHPYSARVVKLFLEMLTADDMEIRELATFGIIFALKQIKVKYARTAMSRWMIDEGGIYNENKTIEMTSSAERVPVGNREDNQWLQYREDETSIRSATEKSLPQRDIASELVVANSPSKREESKKIGSGSDNMEKFEDRNSRERNNSIHEANRENLRYLKFDEMCKRAQSLDVNFVKILARKMRLKKDDTRNGAKTNEEIPERRSETFSQMGNANNLEPSKIDSGEAYLRNGNSTTPLSQSKNLPRMRQRRLSPDPSKYEKLSKINITRLPLDQKENGSQPSLSNEKMIFPNKSPKKSSEDGKENIKIRHSRHLSPNPTKRRTLPLRSRRLSPNRNKSVKESRGEDRIWSNLDERLIKIQEEYRAENMVFGSGTRDGTTTEKTKVDDESGTCDSEAVDATTKTSKVENENVTCDSEAVGATTKTSKVENENVTCDSEAVGATTKTSKVENENVTCDSVTVEVATENSKVGNENEACGSEMEYVTTENHKIDGRNATCDAVSDEVATENSKVGNEYTMCDSEMDDVATESSKINREDMACDSETSDVTIENAVIYRENVACDSEKRDMTTEKPKVDDGNGVCDSETVDIATDNSKVGDTNADLNFEMRDAVTENLETRKGEVERDSEMANITTGYSNINGENAAHDSQTCDVTTENTKIVGENKACNTETGVVTTEDSELDEELPADAGNITPEKSINTLRQLCDTYHRIREDKQGSLTKYQKRAFNDDDQSGEISDDDQSEGTSDDDKSEQTTDDDVSEQTTDDDVSEETSDDDLSEETSDDDLPEEISEHDESEKQAEIILSMLSEYLEKYKDDEVFEIPPNSDLYVAIHKKYLGYYCWPAQWNEYLPNRYQKEVETRKTESLRSPVGSQLADYFSDEASLYKLVALLAEENSRLSKRGLSFIHISLFELLFKTFDVDLLDSLRPAIFLLAMRPVFNHQLCLAEIIVGLLRGSKQWNYEKMKRLSFWIPGLLKSVFDRMPQEITSEWVTAIGVALVIHESIFARAIIANARHCCDIVNSHPENRDVNKYGFLLKMLSDAPIVGDEVYDCARLECAEISLTPSWRNTLRLNKLLHHVKPFLPNLYQKNRAQLGSTLACICDSDMEAEGWNRTIGPTVCGVIQMILPYFFPLQRHAVPNQSSDANLDVQTENCQLETANQSTSNSIQQTVKSGVCLEADEIAENREPFSISDLQSTYNLITDGEWNEAEALSLLKTTCHWILTSACEGSFVFKPEFFSFFSDVCKFEQFDSDPELQNLCKSVMAYFASVFVLPKHLSRILDTVTSLAYDPSWSVRCSFVEFLQSFAFHNIMTLSSDTEILDNIIRVMYTLLMDSILEVRGNAAEALSGFLHYGLVQNPDSLLEKLISMSAEPLNEENSSASLAKRHSAILGICAFISSSPYDVPHYVPPLFPLLDRHLNDPQPIPYTIRRMLGNFKRTHQNDWESHKNKFTKEQLDILNDMGIQPLHYA